MKLTLAFILVILLAFENSSVESLRTHNFKKLNRPTSPIPPFKTFYLTQNIDHFNFKDERTFQQRYLLNGYIF